MSVDVTKKHACVLCNTELGSKEELQVHFRKHANKEINNKGLPLPQKVQKTNDIQLKIKVADTSNGENKSKIPCDVCGEEFSNSTSAIQHKFRKHPEVTEKHYCPYCGMQFTMKNLFDKHIINHETDTREKNPTNCEICNAEFYFKEAEEYHKRSTHKRVMTLFQPVPTTPPSKKIKMNNAGEIQSVYYCHLCGSEYIMKFNLQKHLEKAHSEEERNTVPTDLIKCTTCDALFYNRKAYDIHNINHKPTDLYVTSEQQRLQTVSRVDQDFDISRVLPPADKYLKTFKHRSKQPYLTDNSFKVSTSNSKSDEELSPPSSPDPTESDSSDSDAPLAKLVRPKTTDTKTPES